MALLGAGCVAPIRSSLVRQVAFDEKCPPEKIQVVEWGPWQQSAHVDACGKTLAYHNHSAGHSVAQWSQGGK